MKAQNDNSSSPFYKKVDTGKLMMLGHSFGAACVIYATTEQLHRSRSAPRGYSQRLRDPVELKAAALCGINTSRAASLLITRFTRLKMTAYPWLSSTAALTIMPRRTVTKKSYELIADPPKMMVLIKGANHYASLECEQSARAGRRAGQGAGSKIPMCPRSPRRFPPRLPPAGAPCSCGPMAWMMHSPGCMWRRTGKCLDDQVEVMIDARQRR